MTDNDKQHKNTVQWPAILKLHGADELIHIQTHGAWISGLHLQVTHLTGDDYLIDSSGQRFDLPQTRNGNFNANGDRLSLQQVIQLVRMHAAQDGACCVSKLHANSIEEAIGMIA